MESGSSIEYLNALPLSEFLSVFRPLGASFGPPNNASWKLHLQTSSTIQDVEIDICFEMIRKTSSAQYAASSIGWHPTKKKQEMRLPDLKYLLAKEYVNGSYPGLSGFMSFMLTYEDGIEVIYCYELHVEECCQGKGLGKCLMRYMEDVGRKAGVKKAMLTVFRANGAARRFYERLGYTTDEFSPRPKRLRGGVVKEPDYLILSKSLVDDPDIVQNNDQPTEREIAWPGEEDVRFGSDSSRKHAMLRNEQDRLQNNKGSELAMVANHNATASNGRSRNLAEPEGEHAMLQQQLRVNLAELKDEKATPSLSVNKWLEEQMPKFQAEEARLSLSVNKWLEEQMPRLQAEEARLSLSVNKWLEEQMPKLQAEEARLSLSVDKWLEEQMPKLQAEEARLRTKITEMLNEQMPKLQAEEARLRVEFDEILDVQRAKLEEDCIKFMADMRKREK